MQQNSSSARSRTIIKSGYLFIAVNFLLGFFNLLVGFISGSLAITSDALHSFIDSIAGFLIIISERLTKHRKFSEQRAKIERFTTIVIACIIIIAGIHIFIESIEKIFVPDDPEYSTPTIIVLITSLALKYLLAIYLKNTGRKLKSTVLSASGAETMNDAWISIAVLTSAIIYLIWRVDIEAYISIIISLIIIKVGLEFIFPHISKHHHHHLEQDSDHDHCGKQESLK